MQAAIDEHLLSIHIDKHWEDIGCLSEEVVKKLKAKPYARPTKIQYLSIGETIEFIQPVIAIKCRNGGGKTLTFAVPAIEFAYRERNRPTQKHMQVSGNDKKKDGSQSVYCPVSIILADTQPLVDQICKVINEILPEGVRCESLMDKSVVTSTAQILVATPQLLWKYASPKQPKIRMDNLQHLAVDEADKLITSFEVQFMNILNLVKRFDVVIQLVSATLSQKNIKFVTEKEVKEDNLVEKQILYSIQLPWKLKGVAQYYVQLPKLASPEDELRAKFNVCKELVDGVIKQNISDPQHASQVIIFFTMLSTIQFFEEALSNSGGTKWKFTSCSNKHERNANISNFRAGSYDIMLASPVMSRGIDIRKVGLVINFDLSINFQHKTFDVDSYLHNIGRTGRYADFGVSLTLLTERQNLKQFKEAISKELESEINVYQREDLLSELKRVMQNNYSSNNHVEAELTASDTKPQEQDAEEDQNSPADSQQMD